MKPSGTTFSLTPDNANFYLGAFFHAVPENTTHISHEIHSIGITR
jgi:hypothetical protein